MNFSSVRRALVIGFSFLILVASGGAHAAFRQYLSTAGNDGNPCTLAAPCRLLPAALALVDPGGEIWMLDSANFNTGPISITKSVTILAIPGHLGSFVGINAPAISIGSGINVTLQNLNILSFQGTGTIGVEINNAAHVSIVNCNIFNFTQGLGTGIQVNTAGDKTRVNVVGSVIRNNLAGIRVTGDARATVSKSHVLANTGSGVEVSAGGTQAAAVHVIDSVSSGNANGFVVTGCAAGCISQMFVTRSVATENTSSGFVTTGTAGTPGTGPTAVMVVGDSMSTRNGTVGFNNLGGDFRSRGNNTVAGNVNADTQGTITPLSGL